MRRPAEAEKYRLERLAEANKNKVREHKFNRCSPQVCTSQGQSQRTDQWGASRSCNTYFLKPNFSSYNFGLSGERREGVKKKKIKTTDKKIGK